MVWLSGCYSCYALSKTKNEGKKKTMDYINEVPHVFFDYRLKKVCKALGLA